VFVVALVWLALFGDRAWAEPSPGTSDREAEVKARELYRQGLAHYNLAEFDAAINKFKSAYTLSPEPELLFNLGQAYRFRRPPECTQALWHFRAYLRAKPESPQRAAVERLVETMKRCAADDKRLPNNANRSADEAPSHVAAGSAVATQPLLSTELQGSRVERRRSGSAPLWMMGGSVLLAGAGVGLLLWSDARYDTLVTSCAPGCTRDAVRGGALAQQLGIGFAAVGGVAIAGSVMWWLLGREQDEGRVGLVVSSAGLGASGTF
jgi:hypothetical protein